MRERTRCVSLLLSLTLSAFCSCVGPVPVTAHFADGNVSSSGTHLRGLRSGPWTDYYDTGRKQSEGQYVDDVQSGMWTWWFENGNKEMEGRFVDEKRDGVWTTWYENGALRARGRFERGFEEGPWQFYASSGALEHEGCFESGKPVLRWTWHDADGAVRTTGNFLAGVKVGDWTTRSESADATVVTYPMPAGYELIEVPQSDSKSGRTGFMHDGVQTGRWISRHPNGTVRLECTFDKGTPNARAWAWRADGSALATGTLQNGCVVGEWSIWRGTAEEKHTFENARPRQSVVGDETSTTSTELSEIAQVELWLAQTCAPLQPAPIRSVPAAMTSNTASQHTSEDVGSIPARAQPWTEYELGALPALVQLYGPGKSKVSDGEGWDSSGSRPTRGKAPASIASSDDLVGHKLPLKQFTTADGRPFDFAELEGKRNVLITILRGFGGQVCVYCAAQTKGLADFAADFAAHDTQVVVLYPGPKSGFAAFLEAYRRTFGADAKVPYELLYDTDLALTRALHIEDNLAMPTSILLDRNGVIRWSHVGKDYADRPSAREILGRIEKLPKGEN